MCVCVCVCVCVHACMHVCVCVCARAHSYNQYNLGCLASHIAGFHPGLIFGGTRTGHAGVLSCILAFLFVVVLSLHLWLHVSSLSY